MLFVGLVAIYDKLEHVLARKTFNPRWLKAETEYLERIVPWEDVVCRKNQTVSSDTQSTDRMLECVCEVRDIQDMYPAIISLKKQNYPTPQHYSSSRILSPLGRTTLPMYMMELVLLSFTRNMKG